MKADQPTDHPDARETRAHVELLKLTHDEGLESVTAVSPSRRRTPTTSWSRRSKRTSYPLRAHRRVIEAL